MPSSGCIYFVCTNDAHKATDRQSVNLLQAVQVHEFLKLVRDVSPLKIIMLLQPRWRMLGRYTYLIAPHLANCSPLGTRSFLTKPLKYCHQWQVTKESTDSCISRGHIFDDDPRLTDISIQDTEIRPKL